MEVFGRLTVINKFTKNRRSYAECLCSCGNKTIVRYDCLKDGNTKSCGCLKKEQDKINLIPNHIDGRSKTRLYKEWEGIKRRCYLQNEKCYPRYGGRGIKMCKEWLNNFETFRDWALNNGYKEELSIDRINVNGNYEPSNCRWVDNKTQCNNRRTNIKIIHNNKTQTLMEWCEELDIPYKVAHARYQRDKNISFERLFRPVGTDRDNKGSRNHNSKINEETARQIKIRLKNKEKIKDIAEELNISRSIVSDIKRGRTWKNIQI